MRDPDIEVRFIFNGERNHPAADGYRPAHLLNGKYLTTGIHHYYETNSVAPNESAIGTITFVSPEYYQHSLSVGETIQMQEGKRIVGSATVLRIMNPMLDRNYADDMQRVGQPNPAEAVENRDLT